MTAPGLRQIRDTATRRERERSAAREVDALFHDWCGRPHESCVCESNPHAGVARPLPPMGARLEPLLARGRAA